LRSALDSRPHLTPLACPLDVAELFDKRATADRLAAAGLPCPPSLPTPAEQFEVAAIHERLARMRGVLYNVTGLSIARVTPGPTSWAAGPTSMVIIGDDFFALPAAGKPRAQLELLLRAIVTATTGVSGDAVPRYIDLVNQIRIHR